MSGPLVDPQTGLPVAVADPLKAEQDLLSGALELRTDVPTQLVDTRTGAILDADAPNVGKLLGEGYRLATAGEVAKEDERQKYDTLGKAALATGAGALRGGTLGLSDVAIGELGGAGAKEELLKLQEHQQVASLLGEGLGTVGAMALTSGVAGTVGAPARLLARGGQLAAEGIEAGLGATTVLGKAGSAAVAYGLTGAAEGALYGAAKAATDDYLRDHEITAERIFAGAGTGALWGGALGGSMGAGFSLLGSGAKKLTSLFEHTDAERDAARQLDDVISAEATAAQEARAAVDSASDAQVSQQVGFRSDDQITAELISPPTQSEQLTAFQRLKELGSEADAARKFKLLQQDKTRELTARGNRLNTVADDLSTYTNVSLKPETFKPIFEAAPPPNLQKVTDSTVDAIGGIRDKIEAASNARHLYEKGGLRAFKAAIEDIDEITGKLKAASNLDDVTDIYIGADRLKRRLGRLQDAANRGPSGDAGAQHIIRDAYEQLRNHLEDTTVFGSGAPLAQKEINASWSSYLDYANAMSKKFEAVDGIQRSAADGFAKVANYDPAKVGSLFSGLGKAENELNEKIWAVGLERKADLLETLSKWYKVPDNLKESVKGAREDVTAMVRDMRDLRALNETAETYRDQLQTLKDTPFLGEQAAKLKVTVGKAVSFLSKTDARAAGRVAAEAGADVHNQTAVKLATQGEKQATKASDGLLAWLKDSAIKTGTRANKAIRSSADAIAKAGPLMGVQMDLRNPATYERAVQNIGALQDPKSDERKIIRARTYSLRQSNPPLADALEAHTQNVANFLAAKAGALSASPKPGDPFGDKRKPRHDPAKAAKLARYMDAAQNPSNAMERLSNGEIRREDIETLQALYPRLYGQVVERVMSELGSVEKMPSYEARLKLGHLLNAPADPSMRPENVAALQRVARSNAQPNAAAKENGPHDNGTLSPSKRRAPEMAKMYATRSQQVAGARFDE